MIRSVPTATRGEASIDIAAPPERVYDVVTDVTRMGERSPECYRCEWLDGATQAVVGVVGAALLGSGFVIQQREASQTDVGDELSFRLLAQLMQRRVWWLGIASMAAGYVLAGWSLGSGNLVLVEPLLAANLLFA